MEDSVLNVLDNLKVQLPEKPKLVSWVSVVDIGDSRLQFRGNDFFFTLENELFCNVFLTIHKKLDGDHSLREILDSESDSFRPTTIEFLLKVLCANGLIHENKAPAENLSEDWKPFSSQIAFLSRFTRTPLAAFQKIRSTGITVVGPPDLQKDFNSSLAGMGFKAAFFLNQIEDLSSNSVSSLVGETDVLIAISDSLDFNLFDGVNSFCLENGLTFCCLAVEGDKAVLGPTIVPFQSPCVTCLRSRYFSHEGALSFLLNPANSSEELKNTGERGNIAPFYSVLFGELVLEVTRFLTGIASPKTIGGLYEYDGLSPVPIKHQIFKIPRCEACSTKSPDTSFWSQ